MNSDILDSLRSIITNIDKKYDDPNVVHESNRLLVQFNKYLEEEQINPAELGNYLLFIFNKEYGLTKFMSVVYPKQSFRKPMCQCLEILYLLINNFPVKTEKYIQEINKVCILILRAFSASSDEKVKALSVLILGFEKIPPNVEYMDHYVDIYKGLQHCLTFKIGDSIAEKVYECLGLYVKLLDYTINDQEQRNLRTTMFFKIKEEMMKADHSKKLVGGLFIGLTHLFERLPFGAIEDKKKIDELYKFIKTLAENAEANRIRTSSRAALIFMQQNMTIFGDEVFVDHKFWHKILILWLTKLGADDKKVSSKVILTLYRCITEHLIKDRKQEFKNVLKNYLASFRKGLDKEDSTILEKQTYIHGIKLFFRAAPVLLTHTEVTNFSLKLLHAFKATYVTNQDTTSDDWPLLPDHVQMITSVITSMGTGRSEVVLLKQSLILMVKTYHSIPILNRSAVTDAFLSALYSLRTSAVFDSFLSDLIYQSVIWSCSHSHVSELELSEDNKKLVTVKDYLYFWNSICKMEYNRKYDEWGMDIETRRQIFLQIVHELIVTLFVSVNKLDVSVSLRDTNSTDIKDLFEINEKNDFAIFLNIVDFYEEILTKINSNILSKCIYKLLNFFVEKSSSCPMISGFYRLLAVCLKVANNVDYFNASEALADDGPKQECRQTLSAYMQSLLSRMLQFRDELLISSLKVFLECPSTVVGEMLPACVPAFTAIFTIGRNYMPVAELGIRTLEIWQKNLQPEEMEEFLCLVVPAMDAFLRSKSLAYASQDIQKKTKTSRALAKRKMVVEIEPELVKLQRRMLRFVGRQSPQVCEKLIDSPRVITDVWGDASHLKVTLPFEDVKLNVYLDRSVPKVAELALNCSDRKMRIMACELLQALVILFLGTTKQMTDKGQRELEGLLRKFSFVLLELGSDPDEVVRQLFEPLFLQMVHWYSSPLQYKKCHTAVIIETLTDGVCSPTNSNLRTFSGKCIGEFIKWTIKQSNEGRLVEEPSNIKAFVKRMRFFSTHPDNFKKLGAALIFNNLYVFLREERGLLNMFWIEIFEIFVSSLHSIWESVEDDTISVQIVAALKHLQRGFTEKSELFNKPNEKRRKPAGFKGTRLIDTVEYLLANSSSKSPTCREKCMELFCNIIPFVFEARSPSKYFENYVDDPLTWLLNSFESYLVDFTSLTSLDDLKTSSLLEWMSELERGLDGFTFTLKNGILIGRNLGTTSTVLAIKYYLEYVASSDIKTALKLVNEQEWVTTTFDRTNFANKQVVINKKILKFCYHCSTRGCEITPLWTFNLWRLVTNMIFGHVGNAGSKVMEKGELEMFLKSCLPSEKSTELVASLRNHVEDHFSQNFDLGRSADSKRRSTINGLLFLQNSSFNQVINFNSLLPKIVHNFLAECVSEISRNSTIHFDDIDTKFYSSVLEFGLKDKEGFGSFVDFLYVACEIHDEDAGKNIPFGLYLLNNFESATILNILENFDAFLQLVTARKNQMERTVMYVKRILSYLHSSRRNVIQTYGVVLEKFYNNWESFDAYFCEKADNLKEGLEIISLVSFLRRSDFCTNWLVSLIVRAGKLGFLKNDLNLKVEVLELFFESFNPINQQLDFSQIRVELDQLIESISKTSDKNAQGVCLLKISKLFHALQRTRTSLLFDFIVNAYLQFPETEEYLKDPSVCQKYMMNVPQGEQIQILEIIVKIMKSTKYPLQRKIKLGKNILVVVFQSASLQVFENFFVLHVKSMLEELKEGLTENTLGSKVIDFLLVELLFARLPIGEENEVNMRIQMAAFGEDRPVKDLLRFFLKYALNAFRDNIPTTETSHEMLRIYRCYSYNALVSVATNALNDPNFHVKLFTRLENSEDILWKGLVDPKKTYKFEKDFSALPQKKKVLVNIRGMMNENNDVASSGRESIRSQRIFNSSLSEDITKYDMSNVTVRSDTPQNDGNSGGLTEVALDYIDLNDHECMATICGLINHLANTDVLPNDEDWTPEDIPECLKGLRSVLLKDSTSVNVRIFLIKIIENTSHIFIKYSTWFLAPVMKFLVDKCAGDDINFFITDLVVMLANWSEKAVPQDEVEEELATKLIKFLFDKLSLERRDVFKFNLLLLKIILQAWKDIIRIPEDFLHRIKSPCLLEKEVEIHICSVLLINDVFVFSNSNETIFLKFLTYQLNSSKKSTYIPCSETLGLLLKKWHARDIPIGYSEVIEPTLRAIWDSDKDKGGYVLEGITIHCPAFIKQHHVIRLLSRLNTVPASSQHVFLKVILRAIDVLEEVSEFKSENWERYINSESVEVQVVTLSLMRETLDILANVATFRNTIGTICEKRNTQNDLCKRLVFDIMIKICIENINSPDKYSGVAEMCRDSLIDGLTVDDPDLLSSIRKFWSDSGILSTFLMDRFLQTLSIFYKPKNEHIVLGSGVYFLAHLVENDEDFDKELFDHPLEDCRFEDYELTVNSATQHPYCVPMFAETCLETFAGRTAAAQFEFGELRATQDDLSFAPTVPTKREDHALASFVSSQSQLLFDASEPEDVATFKNPNDLSCKVFKRRFLRDKSKISELCANFEVRSNVQKGQKRISRAKERDRKVCISRKYRKGDFPDIQIPFSSIIVPLQMLASENSDIAKIMYVEIFKSIKGKLDGHYWLRMSETIANIFKSSVQFNTNLFRALLDLVIVSESKIVLDPYLVTESCLSSGLVSTGTLIIEGYIRNFDEIPQIKRIRGADSSEESIYWIKLAELYKEMNEWDVVCAIFQEKVPCDDRIKSAITSESRKLWVQAQDLYRYLIEKDLTVDKRDFYYEAYFRCFANLGQWEDLAGAIKTMETPDQNYWDALWDEDWKQKKLLPWLMMAEVNDMLFKEQPSKVFFENVNSSLCDNPKAEILKASFPEYLALMWIVNGDLDTAEAYLSSYADSFLGQWEILDPMFRNMRLDKVMKLRDCSSIYEFVDIYRSVESTDVERAFESLRLMWSNLLKGVPHSVVRYESSLLYHRKFAGLIRSKIVSLNDPDLNPFVQELEDTRFKIDLGLIDAALREDNFYMARKYCKSHKTRKGMSLYMAKMMFIKARSTRDPNESLKSMLKSLEIIVKDVLNSEKNNEFLLSTHLTSFQILQEAAKLISDNDGLLDGHKENISRFTGQNVTKSDDLPEYGAKRIIHFLRNNLESRDLSQKSIAEAYVKLAYYSSEKGTVDADNLNMLVLRAMKLGSKEARQLFPCLLQQEGLGSVYKAVFIQECASVPTWMFLGWIPQLLANLNSEKINAIDSILLRISQIYPQAIVYPYRLSKESFKVDTDHFSNLIKKMDKLLLNEDTDIFLKALGNVSVPNSILDYYINRIVKHATIDEKTEVQKVCDFIVKELFEHNPDSSEPVKLQGNAFKKMSDHNKHFKQLAGDKKETIILKMQKLKATLQDEKKKTHTLLRDYCPWLANFSANQLNLEIEIPGQYNGQKMPLSQYHAKIRKFHPEVMVMSSLRKPIKITILGDNTREYPYLVKFGEDIRQDQRVEQLFVLMNEVLQKNGNDSRQMALATFEVIPLTTSLGMIQWVSNTEKLQDFMKKAIKDKNSAKNFPDGPANTGPLERYFKFIHSSSRGKKRDKEAYGKSAQNHDRNKTIGCFRGLVNDVEADVLRKAFWMVSTSTESFVALRHNFARSYASMCAAHWLLGIGDRHLGNSLIGLDDGRVIGIDFGHAFGTATQCLGVPELVPFRLTPQIVAFMEPFKEKGHFRESMIHTVRSLRESKKLLLATMSVFMKEPSLDWLEKSRDEENSTEEKGTETLDWYPAQKIDQARRKLEGVNPTAITIEDLEGGLVKEYLDAYRSLVEGVSEYDYRAQVPKNELSVEEQVDCLIDQAGDYNLLGRMYHGWRSWV